MMNTDKLQNMAWDAEDSGQKVQVFWHSENVIDYISIEGDEYFNAFIDQELENWESEAEGYWRQ